MKDGDQQSPRQYASVGPCVADSRVRFLFSCFTIVSAGRPVGRVLRVGGPPSEKVAGEMVEEETEEAKTIKLPVDATRAQAVNN